MTEDFDKEMDALLRQASQGETAFAANNAKSKIQNPKSLHLDADEISLFAENALPKKLRENAVVHFADCDRCRKILSDSILQNSENEIVSAGQTEVFAPTIPWYRKFFAFPNLAYTLGALVLVFSGVVAFTVLQSVENSQNSEVSQVTERQQGGSGMSSDGEVAIVEKENSESIASSSMSNAAMANSASMSNSASSFSSNAAMMSNAPANSAARSFNANAASNTSTASNKSNVSANESAKAEPRREEDAAGKVAAELPLQSRSVQNLTREKREHAKEDKSEAETTDTTKSAAPKPEQSAISDNDRMMSADAPKALAKKTARLQSVETISVGGKTFRRAGNVWVDAAYKGQATTNITRGTSEYKKLDSGLRLIAENLGGTVIIVRKDKAYRIQ